MEEGRGLERERSESPDRWIKKMNEAKKEHRPRLKNWQRDGFGISGRRAEDFARFASERLDSEAALSMSIPVVDASQLSLAEFWDRFEKPELPVIIRDVPQVEGWRAADSERWSIDRLNDVYGDVRVKCGEDDEGYAIKVRIKHFISYLRHQQDDSPLYVFDSHFDEHKVASALMKDYKVPSYFPDDLFELVGERRRPPYRWFLIGPKRSGTCVHIDPLGTSAWNTVLVGRKRWVIFPPHTEKDIAKGKTVIRDGEDDEAINFFIDHLPRLKRIAESPHSTLKIYEFIQHPGDTVYIPGGWWHAVLNLDDTVAITQNFCSRHNFPKVWRKTRSGRKKMAVKWLRELRLDYPNLANIAEQINASDRFVMADEDERRREKKSKKKHKKHKHKHHHSTNGSQEDMSDAASSHKSKKKRESY